MQETKQALNAMDAIQEGTGYFAKNFPLVLAFHVPYFIFLAALFFSNVFVNPFKLVTPQYSWVHITIAALMLVYPYAAAFLIQRVASTNEKFAKPEGSIAVNALKLLPGMIALQIAVSSAVIAGSIFLIIPGLILAVFFSFAEIIYVLNGGLARSVQESFEMVKGNFWNVVLMIVGSIVLAVMVMIVNGIVGNIVKGIASQITAVMINTVSVMYYFWMLALYRQIKENKNYEHEKDRSKAETGYKVFTYTFLVLGVLVLAGIIAAGVMIMPKAKELKDKYLTVQNNTSTISVNNNVILTAEEKATGKALYTYYDNKTGEKMEIDANIIRIEYTMTQYYKNGNPKQKYSFSDTSGEVTQESYNEDGTKKVPEQQKERVLRKKN